MKGEKIYVAGLIKNSFIDWPGKISSVIFLGGCNFKCPHCHNRAILCSSSNTTQLNAVLCDIKEQIGFVDGVVISGGEPTLHPNLREIIATVRELGLAVKLDTNGSNYAVLRELVEGGLVDYVAMDIKAPLERYKELQITNDISNVKKSITYLKNQKKVPFMFRTTPIPELIEVDFAGIAELVGGTVWRRNDFVPQG